MKSLSGYTSITTVYNFLGSDAAVAVLSFHSLAGCDSTRKFSGRLKEFWIGKFLSEGNNVSFIQALNHLQQEPCELARFICRSCPKSTPKRITDSLVETRYFLYKRFSADTNKVSYSRSVPPACYASFLSVSSVEVSSLIRD